MGYTQMTIVYDMDQLKFVQLRPYMKWTPHIIKSGLSDEVWEQALKDSVTDEQYVLILNGRNRMVK